MKTENYVFISYLDPDYSRTSVYFTDSRRQNYFFWRVQGSKLRKFQSLLAMLKKYRGREATYIVMSPCHSLVIPLRFLTWRPIILDAGWSLSEALKARRTSSHSLVYKIHIFLIDFLSFHLSTISIFESMHQCIHVKHKFLLRKSKLKYLFTGFNEVSYRSLNPLMPEELVERPEFQKDYLLFRGSFTNEAGLDILYRISQLNELSDYRFVVATNRQLVEFNSLPNLLVLNRRLLESEIKYLFQNCLLTIGQIRKTQRLANTIPHKAFEAAYFIKPYLTADASGIRELYPGNNHAIYINSEDPSEISELMKEYLKDKNALLKIGLNAKDRYDQVASQQKLQDKFFEILTGLNCS